MSHRFSSAFEAVIDNEIDCLYPSRAFFKPDYGYAEGTTWLIMEFCDSGTLQVRYRPAVSVRCTMALCFLRRIELAVDQGRSGCAPGFEAAWLILRGSVGNSLIGLVVCFT